MSILVLKDISHLKTRIFQVNIFINFTQELSPPKLDTSRNFSCVRETSVLMKSKISRHSRFSKKSTIKVKKGKKSNFQNRSVKKRFLTMNKAYNKKFNTQRRNKDKFLLPPIYNGVKISNTGYKKPSFIGNFSDSLKQKINPKKLSNFGKESSRIMRHRSPLKGSIFKKLSDPMEIQNNKYVRNYNFSVKKQCRICLKLQ